MNSDALVMCLSDNVCLHVLSDTRRSDEDYPPDLGPDGGDPTLASAAGNTTDVTIPAIETRPTIHFVEDDSILCELGRDLFQSAGYEVAIYQTAEKFLNAPRPTDDACLVVDMSLPGMTGLMLLETLQAEGCDLPSIMLTGHDDAKTAVAALKAGAHDFIEKPADSSVLINSVAEALEHARVMRAQVQERDHAMACFDALTPRENDVLEGMLDGKPNKIIAAGLEISQRTVEYHRASVMSKTGASSLTALVQLYLTATRKI